MNLAYQRIRINDINMQALIQYFDNHRPQQIDLTGNLFDQQQLDDELKQMERFDLIGKFIVHHPLRKYHHRINCK